ncbi:MAG: MFS transporter [Pirellulaceae bacterium]|nr:MAG: MFS transporter [Pirellulaceae bacterium]
MPAEVGRPSRARWVVLGWLCSLSFLLYVDRVCIGQAEQAIREELQLTKAQMSWVFGAFTLAYGLFEVPTGHWGDRFGSRRVLVRIVLWWTAFTALTGAAFNWITLVAVRFLFGAGEAGAFPNTARVVTRWFAPAERGFVRGAVMTMSFLGAAVAPVLAALLIELVGWRATFVVFGTAGVFWAWGFYQWFRDDPADHPSVNTAELAHIRGPFEDAEKAGDRTAGHVPRQSLSWKRVLLSSNTWLMGGVMTVFSVEFYTIFQWFPTYVKETRMAGELLSGAYTGVVMAAGAAGCLLGGLFVDWVNRRTAERNWTRRLCGAVPLGLAALATAGLSQARTDLQTVACCAAALFFTEFAVPNWWTIVAEISGRHGAALWGLMNSMGALGVILVTLAVGYYVDHYAPRLGVIPVWQNVFQGVCIALALGMMMNLSVCATRPIAPGRGEEKPWC